jgi:hypothetical protein
MSRRKAFHKITAMLLSAIMVVGMTPVPASADTGMLSDGSSGEIIAFEALKSEIAEQSVPLGTSEADLELPDSLTATIRLAASTEEPVLDSGEPDENSGSADTVSGSAIGMDEIGDTEAGAEAQIASPSDAQEDGGYFEAEPTEKTVDSVTEITVPLPVTWGSSPNYDADTADTYTFTSILPSGYTVADGVELPAITVAVGTDSILLNALLARGTFDAATEQFTLTPGGTYYFDLSGENIPGTKNTDLPDSGLKWVPFTYAGTVNAYSLDASSSGNITASANATPSDRSLFVADYNITHTVSWNNLHANNLIFGKNYTSGGVAYTLRSLSEGSIYTGSGDAGRGTPETNEWDQILNKDIDYINNWSGIFSWGQDTPSAGASRRALRGYSSSRHWGYPSASLVYSYYGFRPALEILSPGTLDSGGLKTVTLKLNGGKLKGSTDDIHIVYTGNSFTAPGSEGLTAPAGKLFSGWKDDYSTATYVSGAAVPHTVTSLSAQWVLPAEASPTAIFTATGADIGMLSDVANGMKYRIDTGAWIDITDSTVISLTNLSACTIEVVRKGNDTTTVDSSAQEITVTKADTPALTATQPSTIGGNGSIPMTTNHEYQSQTDSTWTPASGNTTLAPGTYLVRIKADGTALASDNQSISLKAYVPDEEATPAAVFTSTGADTGILSGVANGMKYRIDTGAWIDITDSTVISLTNLSACTIEVVKKGNGTTTADSPAQEIAVTKADTPALTATQPSTIGGNGSIPMTTNHEYRSEADSTWTPASGNTSLAPGTYLVRIKANGTLLVSESQSITLTAYVPDEEATPAAIFTATGGNTGTLSNVTDGMKYRIDAGSWIDITDSTGISLTSLSACTIEVVKKGNDTTTADSSAQEIAVTKADTPVLTATQPSTIGGNGSIPMTTNHEYRSEADSTWTPASGNTSLAPGTYLVRIKANGTLLASESQSITLTAFTGGSGGGGGDGGSYTPDIPATIIPEKKPDQPVTATAPVTATTGTNGTAGATIPEKAITDAIAKAQADAKAQGKTANGISVGLNVTMPKGATSLTVTLTQNSLNSLVNAGVSRLELDGAPISLGLDLNALKEIQKQSSGNISITIAPATGLSKEAKALLGNRPVYSVTISYVDKNGKTQTITSLGSGLATLSIPYTPGKNEAVGYLFGVYVDAKGKAQRIPGSAYDANSRSLLIPTGHFSVYGVGYTAPSAKFTDIGTHWGKEAIDYVVGRGLLSGTSKTTFAPDTAITRGMLVTALGRLAGVDVKAYTTNSFTDVKADSAFRPYIEWAYKNGVVQGIGNKQFAPDRAITREEIAVIFANYAKATGYKLPVTREATTYADASSIGSIYKTAVTAMQQAGIMMGGTDNKFNPKTSATRAEVSSMLHRYVKLTIDPTTAQGWALNDAGQYLYYKDGKAFTGTQTIDGAKYFFNTDGTLKTGWVKDGENWRYYSGNEATVGWLDISNKRYYFTKDGLMVFGKWLQIDSKWYYFYADGSLAVSTKVDSYEVDESGARKAK